MAFPDDVFPADDDCEICGARLGDEIVIQEFADGTFARLCPECAAGATFGRESDTAPGSDVSGEPWPAPAAADAATPAASVASTSSALGTADGMDEVDPLEMTKELLMPVADLIALQGEMQAVLARVADSLERFATGLITDSMGRTATVENRLRSLEAELERTRNRLREAESLLVATNTGVTGPGSTGVTGPTAMQGPPPVYMPAPAMAAPIEEASKAGTTAPAPDLWESLTWDAGARAAASADSAAFAAADQAATPSVETGGDAAVEPAPEAAVFGTSAPAETPVPAPAAAIDAAAYQAQAPSGPAVPCPPREGEVFTLEEVQWTQRYFNDSPFTLRMRDVRRSLGRPRANLSRLAGGGARVLVTICWDIVWYQYLVDITREPVTGERVSLFREGMELEELNECFRQKNASINDDGRLDASELEVQLLSDPTVLITELPPDAEKALEDATEEIWDQHAAPEFKWDD